MGNARSYFDVVLYINENIVLKGNNGNERVYLIVFLIENEIYVSILVFILFIFDNWLLVNAVFSYYRLKLFRIDFNAISTISNYSVYEKFYNSMINLSIRSFLISLNV